MKFGLGRGLKSLQVGIPLGLLVFGDWMPASHRNNEIPSLVQAAEREKERRESCQGSRRISTHDLEQLRRAHLSVGHHDAVEEIAQDAWEPFAESMPLEDSHAWAAAFEQARNHLNVKVNTHLVLQLRLNRLQNAFFSEVDSNRQQLIRAQMASTVKELAQLESEESQAREAIAILQARAVDAGLTPEQIRNLTGILPKSPSLQDFP